MIDMTAFDKAWRVVKSEVCAECDENIENAYECGHCGRTLCEECLINDQYGFPGYRGEIDSRNFITHFDGAHCGECVSEIIAEGAE